MRIGFVSSIKGKEESLKLGLVCQVEDLIIQYVS